MFPSFGARCLLNNTKQHARIQAPQGVVITAVLIAPTQARMGHGGSPGRSTQTHLVKVRDSPVSLVLCCP